MSELSHGLLLQDQGRLEEAEACFYSVLAREPDNDFVYGRLALCQMSQTGKRKRALETIGEAVRLKADEPFYHSIKSLILADLHRGKDALESANTAVSLNPEDSFSLSAKASAYGAMERWAEAEEWCRNALAADADNAMAANLLAHVLRVQGKSALNAEAVATLLANDPEDSFAHVNAGWSSLQQGNQVQAEVHFREALRLDPDSDMAREGLLQAFRARSIFYRAYLSYCFFMQRFTGGKQWMIILGIYFVYQIARKALTTVSPVLAGVLVFLWLALVLWVWLAPGVGNFLILLDRSARRALTSGEKNQGIAVGGALLVGVAAGMIGYFADYLPLLLGGLGLVVSTVPASLTFANESRKGRLFFGIITTLVYLATIAVVIVEMIHYPAAELAPATIRIGLPALILSIASTWLGNIRALRRGDE